MDAVDIARLHLASSFDSYKTFIDQEGLKKRNYVDRVHQHKKRIEEWQGLYLVAEDQENIIGFCSATSLKIHPNQKFTQEQRMKRNEKGELDNLYIHTDYQRLGIGKSLFNKAKSWLQQNHLSAFLVWVHKDNLKARNFYEHLGGDLVDEVLVKVGKNEYLEVAYRYG